MHADEFVPRTVWAWFWPMMEVMVPGQERACDDWAALNLERRPSGGRLRSCPPLASSCFESAEMEAEKWNN